MAVSPNLDLSIIIPTYKEETRIGKTLEELAKFIDGSKYKIEVLVVDAGSPDQTRDVAISKAKLFKHFRFVDAGPKPPRKAIKGKQVRTGVFEAKGQYVMFMDADLATPLKYLQQVFATMDADQPVAICVRNLQESHKGLRKLISGTGNFLVQMLLLPGIKDTQCGFKAFKSDAAREIFGRQTILGWGFDMEVLAVARKLGYDIELIDVPDWKDVTKGSKISGSPAIQAAMQTFGDLLNIKWGMMTGRYRKASFHYHAKESKS